MRKYQIFISYRRDGGDDLAGRISDRLSNMGYRVFFDVESMRSGDFNEQLYDAIDKCNDFLLILPPGALKRCENQNDWVRLEIAHAVKMKKNIIPVMMKGFDGFPSDLPDDIKPIQYMQGVSASDNSYFDAAIDKIESYLISRRPRFIIRKSKKPKKEKIEKKASNIKPDSKSLFESIFKKLSVVGAVLALGFLLSLFFRGAVFDFFRIACGQAFHEIRSDGYFFSGLLYFAVFYIIWYICYFRIITPQIRYHKHNIINSKDKLILKTAALVLIAMLISPFVFYGIGTLNSDCLLIENNQIILFSERNDGFSFDGVLVKKGQTVFNVPNEIKGKPVLEIGEKAFYNDIFLKITIPNSVSRIGDSAMMGCHVLEQVNLPDSLEFVASNAFQQSGDIVINYSGTPEKWKEIYEEGWLTGNLTVNYNFE